MRQTLIEFDKIDSHGNIFSKDSIITFPDKINLSHSFNSESIGFCNDIKQTNNGYDCEITLFNDISKELIDFAIGGICKVENQQYKQFKITEVSIKIKWKNAK